MQSQFKTTQTYKGSLHKKKQEIYWSFTNMGATPPPLGKFPVFSSAIFLGARAPLRIARVKKNNNFTKKFQIAIT